MEPKLLFLGVEANPAHFSELAWMVTDEQGGFIDCGVSKNPESEDLTELHATLSSWAKKVNAVINHNVEWHILPLIELFENEGLKDPFNRKRKVCTMKIGRSSCEIPRDTAGVTSFRSLRNW